MSNHPNSKFYAAKAPRGLPNEIDVHMFLSSWERNAWVDDHPGARATTHKRAIEILRESGDIAVNHCECGEDLAAA